MIKLLVFKLIGLIIWLGFVLFILLPYIFSNIKVEPQLSMFIFVSTLIVGAEVLWILYNDKLKVLDEDLDYLEEKYNELKDFIDEHT